MSVFLTNVQLEGTSEVLQVLVSQDKRASVWSRVSKPLTTLNKELAGALITAEQDDLTFASYLHLVGRLFGKDPEQWDRQGRPKIEYSEREFVSCLGSRTIKTTETLWGLTLRLHLIANLYDSRLTGHVHSSKEGAAPAYVADLDYSEKWKVVANDEQWQLAIQGQPLRQNQRRQEMLRFLRAKMQHEDPTVRSEGLHGVLEISVNPRHHTSIDAEALDIVVEFINSESYEEAYLSSSILWALAPATSTRSTITALGAIKKLLSLLKRTLADEPTAEDGSAQIAAQTAALGAIAVCLVDVRCRGQYLSAQPNLETILQAAAIMPGYSDSDQATRRVVAAKLLAAITQRDAFVRECLITHGQLKTMIQLLESDGPGDTGVRFCMASALATLVLDEDVMRLLKLRGEAPMLFVHSIEILKSALAKLALDAKQPPDDPDLTVKMAEAMAQAMWGAAYYCTLPGGGGVEDHHVTSLGDLGVAAWCNTRYELGRVAHCIAATMASLASNQECAAVLMASDAEHGAVAALMLLARVHDGNVQHTGHVRAAAACALSFLSCHNIGARGDDCLTGPYREALLEQGALDCLLQAALSPPSDLKCKAVVEMAASVGVMYLSTMAGNLEAPPLVMLATLLNNNSNLVMVENLMAAVWILLRNPHNRKILGTAFDENPVMSSTIKGQMKDVVDVHEVQEDLLQQKSTTLYKQTSRDVDPAKLQNLTPELHTIGEGYEGASQAVLSDAHESGDEDLPPTLATLLPGDIDDEHLRSRPGSRETAAPIPIDNLEDVSTDDWGLDMLVRVGESWAPNLLLMTADNVKAPLLKLFEFLVASVCLFVIDDDEPPPPPQDDVFSLAGPAATGAPGPTSTQTPCWWTVDVQRPEPECKDAGAMLRTYEILCVVISVQAPQAWKIVQLSLLTLWNICARRHGAQAYVVEKGIAIPLLDICVQQHWPPSVRVMAAGFLASLAESANNTSQLGGLLPMIAANVKLLKSQVPLLELTAARNLARTLYAAPRGSEKPAKALADAKAVAAHQGAITALIRLLQCACGRYALLSAGEKLAPFSFPFSRYLEDDPAEFTRDMCNVEGVLETLYYTAAALLNLSTSPLNQVAIAKRGLRTLFGAQAFMSAAARGKIPVQAGTSFHSVKVDIANILAATLMNVSTHTQNRSRLYRMELTGAVALQQQLLGEIQGTEFTGKAAGSLASAVAAQSLLPPLPRTKADGAPNPRHMIKGGMDDQAACMESILAKRVRPKAVFSPILRRDESTSSPAIPQAMQLRGVSAAHTLGVAMDMSEIRAGTVDSGLSDEDAAASKLFKMWAEVTFPQLQEEDAKAASLATAQFRMVDPETGDWVNERSGYPLLASALRRPVAALLEDTPEALAARGRARWAPPVSEYRQTISQSSMASGGLPARMLQTDAPAKASDALKMAATALVTEGEVRRDVPVMHVRPSTAERKGGRVPLTVLRARMTSGDAVELSGVQGRKAPRKRHDALEQHSYGSTPLDVVISPQRGSTTMSFNPKDTLTETSNKPSLTLFAHEPGSRIHKGLFPTYQMPNGQLAFFYYNPGSLQPERAVAALCPPAKPNSVPGALQNTMPLADVMDIISKPPGSTPPFIPYKPVPPLVPLPKRHTVPVSRPHILNDRSAFGDLIEDSLQFVVLSKTLVKTIVTTKKEDIEVAMAVEREPWQLPKSIFASRAKRGPQQCDAKDYFDTDKLFTNMFETDWARLVGKEKFSANFLARECRNNKDSTDSEEEQIAAVRAVLLKYYTLLVPAFMFYSCSVSAMPFFMGLNEFTALLDECHIPDNESQGVKRSDLDTVFIVCTRKEKPANGQKSVGSENCLFRWEFIEALVRIAISKHGKGVATSSPTEAIDMLFKQHLEAKVAPAARMDLNWFRTNHLYCEPVDDLLKKHEAILRALYSRWRLRPPSGGLRTKLLKADGWMKMMESLELVDDDFTLNNAMLCYVWCRMSTIDEVKDYSKFESLTFVDLLEALGQVANHKHLPLTSELQEAGIDSLQWVLAKASGDTSAATVVPDIFKNTEACKIRPLVAKLDVLLDYMFRKIVYDPTDPQSTDWSSERVLRSLKKQDKDLGS